MSLSRRAFALKIGSLAGLAACGYTPIYGPGGAAGQLRGKIAMQPPQNRREFDLVNQLEQRLGHATEPTYLLTYTLEVEQDGVGVTPDQEIIRNNVFGKVTFSLTDSITGAVLTSGSTDTFTGFSVGPVDVSATPPSTNATIATLAAERDANARLMVALADQIVTRLLATSPAWLQ